VVTPEELDPAAEEVVARVVAERHATLVRAPAEAASPAASPLGGFQRTNFALARAAAEAFHGPLDEHAVARAAAEVQVPGRLQAIADRPLTVLDGAHNPSGMAALVRALPEVFGERRPRVGVVAVLDDKDASGMLSELAPALDRVVFTRSANPRALSPATLTSLWEQIGGPAPETVADPRAALARAREIAGAEGAVVATGSIYLIADLVREDATARASAL
jgi:dihydrofolate synthase/folylpolyglutamate synthase